MLSCLDVKEDLWEEANLNLEKTVGPAAPVWRVILCNHFL